MADDAEKTQMRLLISQCYRIFRRLRYDEEAKLRGYLSIVEQNEATERHQDYVILMAACEQFVVKAPVPAPAHDLSGEGTPGVVG